MHYDARGMKGTFLHGLEKTQSMATLTCNKCHRVGTVKCGGCNLVPYCSDTCAKNAWQEHREICAISQMILTTDANPTITSSARLVRAAGMEETLRRLRNELSGSGGPTRFGELPVDLQSVIIAMIAEYVFVFPLKGMLGAELTGPYPNLPLAYEPAMDLLRRPLPIAESENADVLRGPHHQFANLIACISAEAQQNTRVQLKQFDMNRWTVKVNPIFRLSSTGNHVTFTIGRLEFLDDDTLTPKHILTLVICGMDSMHQAIFWLYDVEAILAHTDADKPIAHYKEIRSAFPRFDGELQTPTVFGNRLCYQSYYTTRTYRNRLRVLKMLVKDETLEAKKLHLGFTQLFMFDDQVWKTDPVHCWVQHPDSLDKWANLNAEDNMRIHYTRIDNLHRVLWNPYTESFVTRAIGSLELDDGSRICGAYRTTIFMHSCSRTSQGSKS